jgi:hypothetical protein
MCAVCDIPHSTKTHFGDDDTSPYTSGCQEHWMQHATELEGLEAAVEAKFDQRHGLKAKRREAELWQI